MPADLAGGGAVLEADGLDVLYGDYQILWDARIRVEPGVDPTTLSTVLSVLRGGR